MNYSKRTIENVVEIIRMMPHQFTIGETEKFISLLNERLDEILEIYKTGHWIDTDEGFSPCECSECKSVEFKKSKFCPNCGAKMESEEV